MAGLVVASVTFGQHPGYITQLLPTIQATTVSSPMEGKPISIILLLLTTVHMDSDWSTHNMPTFITQYFGVMRTMKFAVAPAMNLL